jgi:carbon storage regulator
MLVLSRKMGEKIRINDDITIIVKSIRGHKVGLVVDAPKSVAVHRNEVYLAIQREKESEQCANQDNAIMPTTI